MSVRGLAVREVKAGDATGIGRVVDLHTKGWLTYRLSWQAEVVAIDKPRVDGIAAGARRRWRMSGTDTAGGAE